MSRTNYLTCKRCKVAFALGNKEVLNKWEPYLTGLEKFLNSHENSDLVYENEHEVFFASDLELIWPGDYPKYDYFKPKSDDSPQYIASLQELHVGFQQEGGKDA